MPFMAQVISTLKPGGELWLATNVARYLHEAEDAYLRQWQLTLASLRQLSRDTTDFRTHFEKKYLLAGEDCYQAVFVKEQS